MIQIALMFHVVLAIALIVLILIQQGKGATMGASFGAGASQTVFGSQGAGSFMLKFTGGIGILFFITSLTLGHMTGTQEKPASTNLLDQVSQISKQQKQAQTATQNAGALQAVKELNK